MSRPKDQGGWRRPTWINKLGHSVKTMVSEQLCALIETRVHPKEAHLEVFEQDVREVGSLGEPAVWDDLSLQPLDHTAPQLVAVSSVANHCRGGNIRGQPALINNPKGRIYLANDITLDPCPFVHTSVFPC